MTGRGSATWAIVTGTERSRGPRVTSDSSPLSSYASAVQSHASLGTGYTPARSKSKVAPDELT